MTAIQDEVVRIICEALEIQTSEVALETSIRALPNVESIRILNAILRVEKRFAIEIPDAATFQVETVGEFVELVELQLIKNEELAAQRERAVA
ncbi:MAG: acyl carrier protein [Deltaproteobacteria bacterium]|nr:acyl carrier protein [Deltaproteobacteria bacterium]